MKNPLSTYTPPVPYHVPTLEELMTKDLEAWRLAKEAIKRAAGRLDPGPKSRLRRPG